MSFFLPVTVFGTYQRCDIHLFLKVLYLHVSTGSMGIMSIMTIKLFD